MAALPQCQQCNGLGLNQVTENAIFPGIAAVAGQDTVEFTANTVCTCVDLSRLPDQNRPASPPYSKPHPQTQEQPNHLMNDSTTDFIAELQEAHRMHADGCTEHRIRKMLKRSGAPTSLTEHFLNVVASKSPRDNHRWADWLGPFIDSLTPTPEIKSAHGTARQILDHYHDATLKAVKARNHTDRRNAELSLESAHRKLQLATVETHNDPVPNPTTTRYILNDLTTVSIHTAQNTE